MHPDDLLEKHFTRLRTDQKAALKSLGIHTVRDLFYYFPFRYEAAGELGTIATATSGAERTLFGTIRRPEVRKSWKSRRPLAEAYLEDASGRLKLMWFSQPYIAKSLHDGMVVKVTGKIVGEGAKAYMANPAIDRSPVDPAIAHENLFVDTPEHEDAFPLFPVYPERKGISSLWLHHAIKRCIEARAHEQFPDPIPEDMRERYHLPALSTALIWIHRPRKESDAKAARKRFAFEEVFALQLAMHQRKSKVASTRALPVSIDKTSLADFIRSFPFPPTNAQQKAINDIVEDFGQPHPMRRLLEGDVGSGKTAVAAATSYLVATSTPPGRSSGTLQIAYLCPTEVLAKQHFSTFISYFKDHPIPIGLITGSECRKFPSKVRKEESTKISKAQFRKWVANGEIPIVIGTHAIVEKTLEFQNLAYAIIDEQHRFGITHRKALATKGSAAPHLLSMTATPIPRTLALTIYGDLDLSLLDEMPVGRKPILTKVLGPDAREEAYARVRTELAAGRQAYVICPRINEPDPSKEMALQAKSVTAEAKRLETEVFPNASIDILHSKMKPSEKEDVMNRFSSGEVDILVATSVVEVGVNVPNATVILIEGAERFGLSQLHQLRGRVIRSNNQAYCFVLPETYGENTRNRLKALTTAKNGFELAEYDLQLRGAGELTGTSQWGVSDIAMEALSNLKMVEAARSEAAEIMAKDPLLTQHPLLRQAVAQRENLHGE